MRVLRNTSVLVAVAMCASAQLSGTTAARADDAIRHCPSSAAATLDWGRPSREATFTAPASLADWYLYDDVGHAGNGRRTPAAISTVGDLLMITGDSAGNSGGMAWWPGQTYGRWEVCARSPIASPNYHSVLLLWPDSENWPGDGEIDFMEINDPNRQVTTATVHHYDFFAPSVTFGPGDIGRTVVDATQWHSWAVEWLPDRIVGYVDGARWFEVDQFIPDKPMHLCMQVDDFGGDISAGGQMDVDSVRQYPLR